jgi:hypothetical protein
MQEKTLRERADDAFAGDDAREFADTYIGLVIASWREVQGSLRRTSMLLALIIVAFLVLHRAERIELSLLGIKVTDLSAILALLPAVASYFLYELVVLTDARARHRDVVAAVTGVRYPDLLQSNLHVLMEPGIGLVWGTTWQWHLREKPAGWRFKALERMALGLALLMVVAPVLFFAFAYLELFRDERVGTLPIVASLAFTIFNVVRAGLYVSDW